MEEIKIDKNVPFTRKGIEKPKTYYPFDKMEVGDSFLVLLEGRKAQNVRSNLTRLGHSYSYKNKVNCIFATREESAGIRVFRTQ